VGCDDSSPDDPARPPFDHQQREFDAALDALAEAHQAEVARLARENEGLLKALKQCAAVVSGQTMHKQGLIDALELARAALAGASGAQEGERT
jgi:hypothetical protein